ncbi:MAG: molybdopterin-dependent oxidoreductase [Alphaproteobacteria bacterium]|nr:molybdopterin-dependent oxidoreductase [Alphaproteobacteria bacterium]
MAGASVRRAVCAHDCPSACSLDVELDDSGRVQRVYGSSRNAYTDGVICAKVARYHEIVHNPNRLTVPMIRKGAKSRTTACSAPASSTDDFEPATWDDALAFVAKRLRHTIDTYGAASVLPYHYAGTMGFVMRDVLRAFRHAGGFSGQLETICTHMANQGWLAGAGQLTGPDPRAMRHADLIIIWGCNPVATHVNVMRHVVKARKTRGAKLIVVDPYRTQTAAQADLHIAPKPGTDGALACAVMHCMFRDGTADRAYMAAFTDDPVGFEQHLRMRSPEWASAITGIPTDSIEQLATMYGRTDRAFIRLGIGFSRSRNGPMQVHAVSCLPAVGGKWQYEGGGAFYSSSGWGGKLLDRAFLMGLEQAQSPPSREARLLDMSRLGDVLMGDPDALRGEFPKAPPEAAPTEASPHEEGRPAPIGVHAMIIQNTNPLAVCPDQRRVRQGFARDDLFVVVHEQVFTETCQYADVLLPATNFLEHDDFYTSYGQSALDVSLKVTEPPGEARHNHFVISSLAARLGIAHESFAMTPKDLIEDTLARSGLPSIDGVIEQGGIDLEGNADESYFRTGFGFPDKKFRFRPDWASKETIYGVRPAIPYPVYADHYNVIEQADDAFPFRLITAPSRSFLNSSFNRTEGGKKQAGRPEVLINPDEAQKHGIDDGAIVRLTSRQGTIRLHARWHDGAAPSTVVVESIHADSSFLDGEGINFLTSAAGGAAVGGAVFHDTAVAVMPA